MTEGAAADLRPARELRWLEPASLRPNERNWRRHPADQAAVVDDLFRLVGDVQPAVLNERRVADGWAEADAVPTLLDGHMRRDIKMKRGEQLLTLVGSWTPQQEALILAGLDRSGDMATGDGDVLAALIVDLEGEVEGDAVSQMLAELGNEYGVAFDPFADMVAGTADPYTAARGFRRSPLTVKAVVAVDDLRIIEDALIEAGDENRGKALTHICRVYLDGRR